VRELGRRLRDEVGDDLPPDVARDYADIFLLALQVTAEDELKAGRAFTLPGLGKWRTVATAARPAREGRNPRTGATVTIPARPAGTAVKVSVVRDLKRALGLA
jgi:DNA-binding protein HU-beta